MVTPPVPADLLEVNGSPSISLERHPKKNPVFRRGFGFSWILLDAPWWADVYLTVAGKPCSTKVSGNVELEFSPKLSFPVRDAACAMWAGSAPHCMGLFCK